MAIFHFSVKVISRGKCLSAIAAAAYRAGEKITSEYDGLTHDYTRKRGIVHTEILLPGHAPREYADRATLWNAVEKIEKSKNSRLAREVELALPHELSSEQQRVLIRGFCQKHFVDAGMIADVCFHDKGDGNPHVHILLTTRPINEDGTWGSKQTKDYILGPNGKKLYDKFKRQYECTTIQSTDWNKSEKVEEWRAGWADAVNAALAQQGIAERVDHRSYERQGIDQIPTVHLGPAAAQMERRGIATDRGDLNRKVQEGNRQQRMLRARIRYLQNWAAQLALPVGSPETSDEQRPAGILDALHLFQSEEARNHWQKLHDLKSDAKTLIYLADKQISTVEQLHETVTEIRRRYDDVAGQLKRNTRRLTTLEEHIRQGETYVQYLPLYRQYQTLANAPCKKEAFYTRHAVDLESFAAASRYLEGVLNGHAMPLNAWKAEAAQLTVERGGMTVQFDRLKEEVRVIEALRRSAERALSSGGAWTDGARRPDR